MFFTACRSILPIGRSIVSVIVSIVAVNEFIVQVVEFMVPVNESIIPVNEFVVPVIGFMAPVNESIVSVNESIVPVDDIIGRINGFSKCFGEGWLDAYLIKTDATGQVLGIENNASQTNNLTLSPNPFSHSTRISLGQTYNNIALEVFNLQGQMVAENYYTDCGEITLQRGVLSQGMYFLKLTLDSKSVETVKIVVGD